jgi:hypothetical protein
MLPEQVFSAANALALVSWLLLALWPRRSRVPHIVCGLVVPALLAAAYVALLASKWGSASGGFSSLAGVSALFSSPWLLLAGWIHYLAFDLLVGTWEVRDALARDIPHLLVVPCLALTFMFGPAGWLLYAALRLAYRPAQSAAIV